MEELITDIENTLRLLLNERRKLLLQDSGFSEELLDGELYRNLRNMKQKLRYRDEMLGKKVQIIKEKDSHLLEQAKRIKQLEEEVLLLKQSAGELARPITTSRNSSLPPSKNPIGIPHTKSLRETSGKKVGGQQGHRGVTRLQTATPDELEVCQAPKFCPICGNSLNPSTLEVAEVRQMIDLPAIIVPLIKEYVQMKATCKCGHCVKGEFPKEVNGTVCYGPIIQSTVSYLSTLQDIPFKRLSDLMDNLFGVPMSQGTISNILTRMRKKAQMTYEKIRCEVEHAPVVGGDETGMNINGKNDWMWTFQTELATYLTMDEHRGKAVIDKHFPNGFPKSTLVSDRLSAYFSLEAESHQVCLAHLPRNTNFFVEYLPKEEWPKQMVDLLRDAIHERKQNGAAEGKDKSFKERFDKLIEIPVNLEDAEKQKAFNTFRKGLIKHREHLFTFLTHALVPYDNNGSERSLRPVKTKLKVSGQFKNIEGAQKYATLQSIIQTAKKNKQNPLEALLAVANYNQA